MIKEHIDCKILWYWVLGKAQCDIQLRTLACQLHLGGQNQTDWHWPIQFLLECGIYRSYPEKEER